MYNEQMAIAEFRVSERGQMALPAEARRRWNLDRGGTVEIADLGDSLLIVPAGRGGLRKLLSTAINEAGGLWYHRLCRSVGDRTVVGFFSRAIGRADPPVGAAAIQAITRLPDSIDLISLRELAWPMARLLDDGVRLNLMSLEALAAAEHLEAELCLAVADENAPLLEAAQARLAAIRLID
jgi:AbrB family looped-hinge helix DNA binding protein